ncbi:hypothetical protein ACEQ8H_002436 [Pleosporales sp. CAS-2024a]
MIAAKDDIIIAPFETEKDVFQANLAISEAFGRQVRDAIWMALNPGWETEAGRATSAEEMIKWWKRPSNNKDGKPNTIFLKATVPDPKEQGERRVVGVAIWWQLSTVEGYGENFKGDMSVPLLRIQDDTHRRFAEQMFRSLWKRRIEYMKEVAASDRKPPAIFTLELCAVHPDYQRRGIASRLTQAGLDEAKQRNLECTTEASTMGRHVYTRLGFKDEGVGDITWDVDEEFSSWDKPPNVFLRTGYTSKVSTYLHAYTQLNLE